MQEFSISILKTSGSFGDPRGGFSVPALNLTGDIIICIHSSFPVMSVLLIPTASNKILKGYQAGTKNKQNKVHYKCVLFILVWRLDFKYLRSYRKQKVNIVTSMNE